MNFKNLFFILLFLLLLSGCSTDDPSDTGIDKSANLKLTGTSATDLLSDVIFTSIRVELVYVNGYAPSQATVDNLIQFLQDRTYKPGGINVFSRAVSSSGKAPFDINEIADIESTERTAFNAGDEIAVYIYFADGSKEGDTNNLKTVGSAFRNTSMVIYGETVKTVANGNDKSLVESTVIHHEFGHLFGLVNLGTPLQSDHEDDSNKAHCKVSGCLMNYQLQFVGGIIDMVDNSIPIMDEYCIRDLQAQGGR